MYFIYNYCLGVVRVYVWFRSTISNNIVVAYAFKVASLSYI